MPSRTIIVAAGCAVFALFIALWCVPHTVRRIESDISARATDTLVQSGTALELDVHHQDIVIAGQMSSASDRDAVVQALSALAGVARVDDRIQIVAPVIAPLEYAFEARRTNDSVRLTGYVVNDAQRASVVGLARQAFSPMRVMDRLKTSPGAPKGYDAIVKLGLSHLARLDSGRFEFSGQRARLSGVAPDPATVRLIDGAFELVDQSRVKLVTALRVRPADAARRDSCQRSYDRLLRGSVVRFGTGSASISADSFDLLDSLAAAAKDCADVAVQVQGHTDAMGEDAANLNLSERRAQAVVSYLVREGVEPGMLSARGFGEQQPLQPNDTPSGRAANRRIEFVVVGDDSP
ncbi:MAG: OmpA family protein [Gammaproteobacteria bacterium]